MPIQEFNEQEYELRNPLTGEKLSNYWGYSTVNFFSLTHWYGTEFKQMVKALHSNGIEVILDVVFNHTAEGNEKGPTFSFKGIDQATYYMLDKEGDSSQFSAAAETPFNCNHPVVIELILDVLRYWVIEMHVDGFGLTSLPFSIATATEESMPFSPLVEAISHDPILSQVTPDRRTMGRRPDCIAWAHFILPITDGQNGMTNTAMWCVTSFAEQKKRARNLPQDCAGLKICIMPKVPAAALILSPATMDFP